MGLRCADRPAVELRTTDSEGGREVRSRRLLQAVQRTSVPGVPVGDRRRAGWLDLRRCTASNHRAIALAAAELHALDDASRFSVTSWEAVASPRGNIRAAVNYVDQWSGLVPSY